VVREGRPLDFRLSELDDGPATLDMTINPVDIETGSFGLSNHFGVLYNEFYG